MCLSLYSYKYLMVNVVTNQPAPNRKQTIMRKGQVHSSIGFQKCPYSSYGRFFWITTSHASGNSKFVSNSFLKTCFLKIPHPLGVFSDLHWGRPGYFLETPIVYDRVGIPHFIQTRMRAVPHFSSYCAAYETLNFLALNNLRINLYIYIT